MDARHPHTLRFVEKTVELAARVVIRGELFHVHYEVFDGPADSDDPRLIRGVAGKFYRSTLISASTGERFPMVKPSGDLSEGDPHPYRAASR